MKQYQATVVTCDLCGETINDDSLRMGSWCEVSRLGVVTAWNDPLVENKQFCSTQCAGVYLMRLADVTEVLGHEAMKLLGRTGAEQK